MTVAFVFPGQGAQSVGLLHHLPQHPEVTRTIKEASDVLGVDIAALDNAEALHSTVAVQSALLIAGVATARALIAEHVRPAAARRHVDRRLWRGGCLWHVVLCRCLAARPSAWRVDAGSLPGRLWPRRHRGPRRSPRGTHCRGNPDRSVSRLHLQHQWAPADRRRRDRCRARCHDCPGSPTRRAPCRASGGQRPVALPAAAAGRGSPGAGRWPSSLCSRPRSRM